MRSVPSARPPSSSPAARAPSPVLERLRLEISEAVTNAVIHASRSRDVPGTVMVTIEVTTHRAVEATVRDDGIGMSPRDDSPGLGLGLGLISSVADGVERRLPGDGVGFELWISSRLDTP